jgi:hypothetical protein
MMKTRLMKGRPRLVAPDDYKQNDSVNMWIDEKESDITSVSSASSEDSDDSEEEESLVSEEETGDLGDETEGEEEEEEEEEDEEEEEEDDESRMEQTVQPVVSEQTEEEKKAPAKKEFSEVTPLFKAIAGEEWDSIVTFLETGSWGWTLTSLCAQLYQVEEKSAAAQVRTWVTANKKDGKGEITRLPIHAAIYKDAPFKIIELLVKNYTKGVKNPDSEGNYPLHVAFEKAASLQILTYLMKEYPGAIHIKNKKGLLPTECGDANGISELLNLSISATKKLVETELTKEKGNLEEDRKQLLEVTKELMNLKKIVAERERNMTKDNFLYQKQHLSSAISQLTKLKLDLDKHEDNVLKHHLQAEKKRMDGVLGELSKTKGELDKIKSEQNLTTPKEESPVEAPASPVQPAPQQKKKKSKKAGGRKQIITNSHHHPVAEEAEVPRDETSKFHEISEPTSPTAGSDLWNAEPEGLQLTVDTDFPQDLDESRDPQDGVSSPRSMLSDKSGATSPRKLKTVAARFKKKMNWRKVEKQAVEAE